MHGKAQVNSPKGEKYKDYKSFFEENSELHGYARKILEMVGKEGNKEHKKFVQHTLSRYHALTEPDRTYFSQDWSAYNQAQQKEKIL